MNTKKMQTQRVGAWLAPGVASLMMAVSALGQSSWTQPELITIRDNNTAVPYPSMIQVSNVLGTITKVTVTFNKLTHGYVRDVDALVAHEDRGKLILMSDAGGRYAVDSVFLTFDDAASGPLPDVNPIVSGTYKPSNWDDGSTDNFPDGTVPPNRPSGWAELANLAAFNGADPNKKWYLYMLDDNVVDSGTQGGWTLNLWTTPILTLGTNITQNDPPNTLITKEDTAVSTVVTNTSSSYPSSQLTVKVKSLNEAVVKTANIAVTGTGNTRTITFNLEANANTRDPNLFPHDAGAKGPCTIEVYVEDPLKEKSETKSFALQVDPVNDAPTIAVNKNTATTTQGVLVSRYCNKTDDKGNCTEYKDYTVTVTDVDSDVETQLALSATGSNPFAVAGTNVFYANIVRDGSNAQKGTATFAITPNGAGYGTSTLTLKATDLAEADPALSATVPMTATVNKVPYAVFANPAAVLLPDGTAVGAPYPASVTVSNLTGMIGKMTVTLADVKQDNPNDMAALLVGPAAQKIMLMRGVGGTTAIDQYRFTLDEDATDALTPTVPITSATTWRPSDLFPTVAMPAPAPDVPYSTDLSTLNGTQPNGTWSLYAVDGTANGGTDQRINGGFLMNIWLKPVISGLGDQTTDEDVNLTVNFTVSDYDGMVTNVVASSQDVTLATAEAKLLNPPAATVSAQLTMKPVKDQNGDVFIDVTVEDDSNFTTTQTIKLTIRPVNDPPFMSFIPKQVTRSGVPTAPQAFTIGDVDSPITDLSVSATSNNPKLLPNGNIVLGGSLESRTLTLYPFGNQAGVGQVTVVVTDKLLNTPQIVDVTVGDPAAPLFVNQAPITVKRDAVEAAPYPSSVSVSGMVGKVSEVWVTLFNLSGQLAPTDIGVLLVGPNNQKVVLMNNAGGNAATSNVQLLFRDADTQGQIPAGGPLVSGTYQPTSYAPAGTWPNTPTGALNNSLSVFNGIDPNGNWRLYVVNDAAPTVNSAVFNGGWQLNLRTTPQISPIANQVTDEDVPIRVNVVIGDDQPGVDMDIVATSSNQNLVGNDDIEITGSGASWVLNIKPKLDQSGQTTITLTVTDPDNVSSQQSFVLTVNPVDDPPRFSEIENQTTPAATPTGPIAYEVYDPEGTAVSVEASSSNQTLVPNSNIALTGSGTERNRTVDILPEGVQTGQSTITLTATDSGPNKLKSTRSFVLTVDNNLSFANTELIDIQDNSPAKPYPSVINVANVAGLVSDVRVTINGLTHSFPADVALLLVSPDNEKKVVLMRGAGGGNGISNVRMLFSAPDDPNVEPPNPPRPPENAKLVNGNYSPVDYKSGRLPIPAPNTPYSTNLKDFVGINPNGQWKLYVLDDTFSESGRIERGWVLTLQTGPRISAVGPQTTLEDVPLVVRFTVGDQDTPATNLVVAASTSANAPANLIKELKLEGTGTDRTLTITPTTNTFGTNLTTLTVSDPQNNTDATTFPLTVLQVNDPPLITTATNLVTIPEDSMTNIVFQFSDSDSQIGVTNATVTSSNTQLVPNETANLSISGDNGVPPGQTGQAIVQVTPVAGGSGSTVLSFAMTDGNSITRTNITLVVSAINNPPTITDIANTNVVAGGTVGPILFAVNDRETAPKNLVVTAQSSNQSLVPNSNITFGGSAADRTMFVTAVGNTPGDVTITVTVEDGDGGTAATSFLLTVGAPPGANFVNTTLITIRDANTATPYPATITASGLQGQIHRVLVTLEGLSHTAPDDIDILLVGPQGQKMVLMSDAGGDFPLNNVRLRFADGAAPLPDDGQITPGNYSPSNYGADDSFPAPAPARPYGTALSVFKGTNPNGTWSLYVLDDAAGDSGQIAQGWALSIETAPIIELAAGQSSLITMQEDDTTTTVNLRYRDPDSPQVPDADLELLSTSSNPSLMPPSPNGVEFTKTGGGNAVARLIPVKDAHGTNVLSLMVRRKTDGASSSVLVTNIVTPVNDPPAISRLTPKSTPENTPTTFVFLVSDVDNPLSDLSLEALSGNEDLIVRSNLLLYNLTNKVTGGLPSGTVEFTLVPNTFAVGTVNIFVNASDKALTTSANFPLTISEVNNPPTISSIDPQATQSGVPTGPIAFTVGDPDGDELTITATSDDQTLVRNAAIVIDIPTGPPGDRTVNVIPETGVEGEATITLSVSDGKLNNKTSFPLTIRPSRERIFESTREIVINDNSAATPYPSPISVSGFVGRVSKVAMTVNGLRHGFPADVDVLLVSPAGKNAIAMSDAGGGTAVTNLVLRFDDAAPQFIPQNPAGGLVSGIYKPRNYEGDTTDSFPPPAPARPYNEVFTSFIGDSPNGDWLLFVQDDTPSDSGSISNGWSVTITTEPVIMGLQAAVTDENREVGVPFTIAEEEWAPKVFTFTGSSTNITLVDSQDITFQGSGTNYTCFVTPALDQNGVTDIVIEATNADGQKFRGTFKLTVNPVDQPPSITQVANQVTTAGRATRAIEFKVSDPETPTKDLLASLTKRSSNEDLVPLENIILDGNDLYIVPAGSLTGLSAITMTVTDSAGQTSSTSFNMTVLPASNPLFANSTRIEIIDKSAAQPYPSNIEVSGVEGPIAQVIVTLAQMTHGFPDDVDVLLVGPHGQSVLLMSDAGGSADISNTRIGFNDFAQSSLPDLTQIQSGSYKPTNYGAGDSMPAPAPTPPYGAALSVFNGTDANGTWSLYVLDDESPDSGFISGGWTLDIITTSPRISAIADQETPEATPINVPFVVDDADTPLGDLVVQARTDNETLISSLTVSGTGNDRVLNIVPAQGRSGTAQIVVTVNDGTSTALSGFMLTVTTVNEPPQIVGLQPAYTTPANTELLANFQVSDRETPAEELTSAAFILNAGMGSVAVEGTGQNRVFRFTPAGLVGQTQAGVFVSDGTSTTTNIINLTTTAQSGPVIAPIADQEIPEDTRLDLPILIANSTSPNLTVLGFASNPQVVASVEVQGSGNVTRTVRVTPVADATGQSDILLFATDEFGSSSRSFKLRVTPVDDPPVLGPIANQTGSVNRPITFPLEVSDKDTPIAELKFRGGSSNPQLVSNFQFANDGVNVSATINLVQDAVGQAVCTIFVSDATSTVSRLFLMNVNAGAEPSLSYSILGNQFTIRLSGDPNTTYAVLSTSDFVNFTEVGEITTDALGFGEFVTTTSAASAFFTAATK